MKYFFTSLRHIRLVNFDCEFVELMPGVRITNSRSVKDKILSDVVKAAIGIIETKHFYSSDTFVYYEHEDNEKLFEGLEHLQILEVKLRWIDDILKNSWLHRDNCIVCDTGYLIDNNPTKAVASSSHLQYLLTLSSGGLDTVELSIDDLSEIAALHDKMEMYLHSKNSSSYHFMLEKNFSRIGRSLMFVKQAREARNLAYKITNYCAALETLFTTENMELSHKLSERVAYFVGEKLDKLQTYKQIKKAYAIRSKLTHGASVDKKHLDDIPDIAMETDKILRTVFRKIIDSKELTALFDSSNNRVDEYFEALIFK